MKPHIIVFAKAPVAGRVKTRLIPALGAEGAARLARQMLADTWHEARATKGATAEICADPDPADASWHGLLPAGAQATAQGPGDLGQRLARAAARVVGGGAAALLIGTDCPALDAGRLAAAVAALARHDAVIHPAEDGGYVLLGLSRFDPSLFAGIAWSTNGVARETIARIAALGWSLHIGDTLRDIDEPGDLAAAGMI